jgi:Sensors of blue-light using FAD
MGANMDTRWEGRDLGRGNQFLWEEALPVDLALRLNDVLQYEDCAAEDLWEAIRDWMECRGITRPQARPMSLASLANAAASRKVPAALMQGETALQITRLVYSSRHATCESKALENIVTTSHKNNARDLITGVLVVGDSSFFQLIEGSRDAVSKCFKRIMADSRHDDVQVISCGDVSKRLFPDWKMRMVCLSRIKGEIIQAHTIHGAFQPRIMSEFAIEEFCHALTRAEVEEIAA